ncbi:MAG: hypothetical protein GY737_22010 [Desulfobacteraceae bacterium]|nr:hypothetical protein [Desulfobacteraceae bacterium]
MLSKNTGKSTLVKRSSIIFIFSIAVTVLTGVNAFAQHYLNHGIRDSLTHKERIALIHDEYRNLSWYELKNRVKALEKVSPYTNPKKMESGSFRARLTISEKANLIMEENRNLMHHDIPRIRRIANKAQTFSHPGKDYIYGGFRENLSYAEKRQLINEE